MLKKFFLHLCKFHTKVNLLFGSNIKTSFGFRRKKISSFYANAINQRAYNRIFCAQINHILLWKSDATDLIHHIKILKDLTFKIYMKKNEQYYQYMKNVL